MELISPNTDKLSSANILTCRNAACSGIFNYKTYRHGKCGYIISGTTRRKKFCNSLNDSVRMVSGQQQHDRQRKLFTGMMK
jgi:hypothetical protein